MSERAPLHESVVATFIRVLLNAVKGSQVSFVRLLLLFVLEVVEVEVAFQVCM